MVVTENAGGSVSKHRPPVANPYLKKKVHSTSNSAAPISAPKAPVNTTVGTKMAASSANATVNRVVKNAVTPSKQFANENQPKPSAQHVSAVKVKHQVKANVTPTPKKPINAVQTATKSAIPAAGHVPPAPAKSANHKPTAIKSAIAKPKYKPANLKSQLKSQIAALKNQKKQRLLQREHEKQLAIKEAERKRQQEELIKLAKIREAERKVKEEKRRQEEEVKRQNAIKKTVGGCLSQMVKRVEIRVHWEKRRGVPYQVGEALQYLVTEIERRNAPKAVVGRYNGVVVPSYPQVFNPVYLQMQPKPMLPYSSTTSAITKPKPQPKPLILHTNPMDKYSPFRDSHKLLDKTVCMTKKTGQSFGVTLRFECRSVLVPREDDVEEDKFKGVVKTETSAVGVANVAMKTETTAADVPKPTVPNTIISAVSVVDAPKAVTNTPTTLVTALATSHSPSVPVTNQKPRKKRRRRVNYGVLTVTDASKATFVRERNEVTQTEPVAGLESGDIILAINGHNLGGMTFSDACKAIATTSIENAETGMIYCSLKIARAVQSKAAPTPAVAYISHASFPIGTNPASMNLKGVVSTHTPAQMPNSAVTIPLPPLIPFIILGDKVSGDFTAAEWYTLVRSLSSVRRELSTGLALQPVSQRDVLAACLKKEEIRKFLLQRSMETLEMKLSHEGKKIEADMNRLATEHWSSMWKAEVESDAGNENNILFEGPLTDAKRSVLRSDARPSAGCRCGSMTHEFVNDPKCVLYRDVKAFVGSDEFDDQGTAEGSSKAVKKNKARNAMEAAYIERFVKLRAETEAAKREAEFILNMEVKQVSAMGKAVFAPRSLCTIVLSAIASFAADDKEPQNEKAEDENTAAIDSEDDSDDEDVPLNALASAGSKRDSVNAAGSSTKRPKLNDKNELKKSKYVPQSLALAKILKHISKTHGHLFQEPSHIEYAWYVCCISNRCCRMHDKIPHLFWFVWHSIGNNVTVQP